VTATVSIIVNNFNYERFVSDAIESALAQTWPDVEVIVVDDGSTDSSRSIIDNYAPRVRTIFKNNGGQASALNAGYEAAAGEVIMFLDADDILHVDAATHAARQFSGNAALARIQWPLEIVDIDAAPSGRLTPNPRMMRSGDLRSHIVKYRTHVWSPTSGNAYADGVLQKVMPVPSEFSFGADLYLAEMTALYGTVLSCRESYSSYRVHGGNNWTSAQLGVANIHQRINWTVADHEHVRRACKELGVDCPVDVRSALDVAFLSQRLASLRLDRQQHPVAGDRVLAVVRRALWAAIRHPHHTRLHKAKRVAWLIGVGFGPAAVSRRLIERFYFPAVNRG